MTRKEAFAAWRWFQRKLKLQDWTLNQLDISDTPPTWAYDCGYDANDRGRISLSRSEKYCRVHICPKNCDGAELQTFFHECGHVLFEDMGLDPIGTDQYYEGGLDRLASIIEVAYLVEIA